METTTPTAADSLGVNQPKKMPPRTMKITAPTTGKTDRDLKRSPQETTIVERGARCGLWMLMTTTYRNMKNAMRRPGNKPAANSRVSGTSVSVE